MPSRSKQITSALGKFYQNPVAKVSLELFLSIGAVIFFAMFAIRPTLLTMSDLIKEIDDKKLLDQQLGQKVAALASAQIQYLDVSPRLPLIDEAIPSDPQLIKTLKIIEKTASDQDLVITSLNIAELPADSAAGLSFDQLERKALTFNVGLTGDYQSISRFVENLMQSRRSLVVTNIVFVVEDLRGQKSLRATTTIEAPYFGKKTASKAVTKETAAPGNAAAETEQ